jgi:hypothetical protein
MELVQWATRQPNIGGTRRSRFAVVRNTYRQLSDTSIRTWLDWCPDGQLGTYAKSDHQYWLKMPIEDGTAVESEILFRALDRPEHVSNLLSLELTGAWVNEAREIPWAVIKALQGRVGRYPAVRDGGCIDAGLILDSNPPDDDSWWYRLFEVDRPDNAAIFKQPSGRSPQAENLPNLPPGLLRQPVEGGGRGLHPRVRRWPLWLREGGQAGISRIQRWVYGFDGLNFRAMQSIKRGWDFGLTPACVFTQVTPEGRWLVVDEVCGDDVGIGTFADCVVQASTERFSGFKFEDYGDPAGEQRSSMTADRAQKTCFDILRGKGIAIRAGEQNLTIRLESVRKPLNTLTGGKPQLQISPRCETLRKGFLGRYQYRRVRVRGSAERYHDEPEKDLYSHPHDALQYVATRVFGDAVRGRQQRRVPLEKLYPEYFKRMRQRIV